MNNTIEVPSDYAYMNGNCFAWLHGMRLKIFTFPLNVTVSLPPGSQVIEAKCEGDFTLLKVYNAAFDIIKGGDLIPRVDCPELIPDVVIE